MQLHIFLMLPEFFFYRWATLVKKEYIGIPESKFKKFDYIWSVK